MVHQPKVTLYCNILDWIIDLLMLQQCGTWARGEKLQRIHIFLLFLKKKKWGAKSEHFLVLPSQFIEEFKNLENESLKYVGRYIFPAPHFALI